VGAESEAGYERVGTALGVLRALSVEPLTAGAKVVLSIRPEDLLLSEQRPASELNAMEGVVEQKVFLGEALDWQIKVGERTLLARSHPSIRTPIGQRSWLQVDSSKCVALPAGVGQVAEH